MKTDVGISQSRESDVHTLYLWGSWAGADGALPTEALSLT